MSTTEPQEDRLAVQEERVANEVGEAVGRRLRWPEWLTATFTLVIAIATGWNVAYVRLQLKEMHEGGVDTANLARAAESQAVSMSALAGAARDQARATANLKQAAVDQARAAQSEATAMEKLRLAGEAQAHAMDHLRAAGEAQAMATRDLARNSAHQLGALQTQADAARTQADAVQKQAEATLTASRATDRLAAAGQAQSDAVLQSLDVARTANAIALQASMSAERPWIRISMPGDIEPVVGKEYKIDISLVNVGRSPAQNVHAAVDISIVDAKAEEKFVLDSCLQCQVYTIFPNAQGFSNGSEIGYHPTIKAEALTQQEMSRLDSRADAILVRVRVDYADSNGGAHMTNACYVLVEKFGFTSCPMGNVAN